MEISKKQKTEIMNTIRHQLSIQHYDSMEYDHELIFHSYDGNLSRLENNTQTVFDAIEEMPNYAVHNIIAKLRGNFRAIRRYVLDEMAFKTGQFKSTGEAMDFLYSHMMGLTKEFLWDDIDLEEEDE